MSIWVNSESKIVVQGLTGKEGQFHAEKCREYGAQIVAGVTPGKAGQEVDGVPVFLGQYGSKGIDVAAAQAVLIA